MEAFKNTMKQAQKLGETVASTQKAVFKQFTAGFEGVSGGGSTVITDESELEKHRELEFLFAATKSSKHFQREVIKGIEGIINANLKHIETISRLSEECTKYGTDSPGGEDTALGTAALHFGSVHAAIERERDVLDRTLGTQVGDPLKSMVTGAPLEDARSLTQRYDRVRQEAGSVVMELQKRRQKENGGYGNPENDAKIRACEEKLRDLESSLSILGKEASSAMTAVAQQQQRQTLQRLIAMVEAEKAFHESASGVLDKLLSQMIVERQKPDAWIGKGYQAPSEGNNARTSNPFRDADGDSGPPPPSYEEVSREPQSKPEGKTPRTSSYFLAEVVHPFEAAGPGELSVRTGDYVVVRQVGANGWSEGESRGKAGWFPTDFVEKRERISARKIVDWAEA